MLEAVFGQKSEFVRTPKFGESNQGALSIEKRAAGYKALKSVIVPVLELMFGCFFAWIELNNLLCANFIGFALTAPFLGFFYTGFCSLGRLIDGVIQRRKARAAA